MKLRKIIYQSLPGAFDALPTSQIVAIPNRVYRTNRFHRLMERIQTGTALCSSLFSQRNCIIRRADAVAHNVPFHSLR